jgi:uncharacterized membrane protein
MTATVPLAVWIHLCVALPALAIGVVMVTRPKGTPSHKLIGRIWVALMLAVAISSLWIPHFLHFTWIHLFTLLTLVSIPAAIYKIRTGNVAGHGRTMTSLFLGGLVIAGLFTLLPGRLLGNLLWHGTWVYNG